MNKTLNVVQAFDRKPITQVPMDDAKTLEDKLEKAVSCFKLRQFWLKPHERMSLLKATAQLLAKRKEEFVRLIYQEGGKPFSDALIEVNRAIDGLTDAAEELRQYKGQAIPMGLTPSSENRIAFTLKEPIGVVAAISAFNHPLNLIIHQVAPAIAVGCPIIIKPASQTPLSCLEFIKLLRQEGLEEGWCQSLITDDNHLAEKLATDPRISFLSFIGSAKVGWYLRSKLPPGTRCSLEHGGAAPVIVDASADFSTTLPALVKGGYYHAGQVCVSTQRIFVHESRIQAFMTEFLAKVEALIVGDPTLKNTEVGPLIHPKEVERVLSWTKEAIDLGTECFGGERLSETTIKPGVLFNPPDKAKVSHLEIFGPLTCVYPFNSLNQAIEKANSLPYAFQSSIFTQDLDVSLKAIEGLEAATVLINDHTAFRTDWMPFAGLKHSGYGIGGIPWTMRELSYEKMVILKR